MKGETRGKHLLQGDILGTSFRKREGEAAVLHAGNHQGCTEERERRGGTASDKASAKSKRGRGRSHAAALWLRHLSSLDRN